MLNNLKLRLGLTLWLIAMLGVIILSITVVPQLLERAHSNASPILASAAFIIQSGLLLAVAVWTGIALSKQLGLGAPVLEAVISGTNAWTLLRRQLFPSVVAGILVGGLLVVLAGIAPTELVSRSESIKIPVAAKLLYGGVTEEILMRWGLMTVFIWLPWHFIQKRVGLPRTSYIAGAIVLTAVLFGVGHLPAAAAMGTNLTYAVITYVIVGNAVAGILFGVMYWRLGIESAMLAHALAHAVNILITAL